jgi:hypothetical protein
MLTVTALHSRCYGREETHRASGDETVNENLLLLTKSPYTSHCLSICTKKCIVNPISRFFCWQLDCSGPLPWAGFHDGSSSTILAKLVSEIGQVQSDWKRCYHLFAPIKFRPHPPAFELRRKINCSECAELKDATISPLFWISVLPSSL